MKHMGIYGSKKLKKGPCSKILRKNKDHIKFEVDGENWAEGKGKSVDYPYTFEEVYNTP